MKSADGTFKRAFSCPLLIFLAAVFGFLYSYIDNINPLPEVAMGFFALGGDLLGTIIGTISVVFTSGIIFKGLLLILIVTLVGAFLIGFFMAGYMTLLKTVIIDGRKDNKGFITGIKENFGRTIKSTFLIIITAALLSIIVLVATIPALSTLWSALNGNGKILPLAIFISIISSFAIFFFVLFYNVYISFWYPAITMGFIKFASESKRIIDEYFFNIAGKILAYNLGFILLTATLVYIRFSFKEAMQNDVIFISIVLTEGILLTVWFIGITNFVTSVFAQLTGKNQIYKNKS